MKIFVMPMAPEGCSHYRIVKPYKGIGDNEIIFFQDKDIETPEALQYLEESDYILCRQYHDKAVLKVLDPLFNLPDSKRKKPLKVILDMDDDVFNLDPYSDAYQFFGIQEVKHGSEWLWKDGVNIDIKVNKEYQKSLKSFLMRADIVTVSTERLKNTYSKYNNNVIIVPNAIDQKDWIVPNFKEHKEYRIGWTGGLSHYSDWYEIKDDIERIAKEFPQVKFVIGGIKFDGIFKNINKEQVEYWPWVDATGHGYRVSMMDLDLAIIPLRDSSFNSNKSCIKFYEFSSIKVPTICSNVAPYSDEAPKESLSDNFYESIKYYIENKDKAIEMAEKNYEFVIKERRQEDISKELYKVLKDNLVEKEVEKTDKKKILISCETMTYLSGSPLYNYTLAKELAKNNEVHFQSVWTDNFLKKDLEAVGVKCVFSTTEEYDLALMSQRRFNKPNAKKVINIVHSEYDCETPIDGCDHYVAIRPSIKEHLIKEHGIKEENITVIYNGVDLERFKPVKKTERDYIKIVIPATIDPLRQKMFDYYTSRASRNFRIFIFGKDFGANIPDSPDIIVSGETDEIEKEIADADLVAGILLGRINLEARACDVPSVIHNPDNPDEMEKYFPDRKEFEEKHDIKKVAKQLLNIYA
jgi:glycosyltransferase involved in cell wall biosynthesis